MAAFFKTAAPPGHASGQAAPRPVITRTWRLDASGRLASRWRPAGR